MIALGGHAILPSGTAGTIDEQVAVTSLAMARIADLLAAGRRVTMTHGNGPIVGNILVRNEAVKDRIPAMPLDVCGADSQGGIGYMIQQTLRNVLGERGIQREVVTLVTQVVVDPGDPAFGNPVKPIGPHYPRDEAMRLQKDRGWQMVEDRDLGFRRVVASPRPVAIVELPVISQLVQADTIVITAGGGGIPVTCRDGRYAGCEAVIDKDMASALLAHELGAERLIIVTDVDAVYENFGTPRARALADTDVTEIKRLDADGQFPAGSMKAKLRAAVEFVEGGKDRKVIICGPRDIAEAAEGHRGTTIHL